MTVIDLSRLPVPNAIENLGFEPMLDSFFSRFLALWEAERLKNPALPPYHAVTRETGFIAIIGQVWSYLRLLDRQRVNDVVKSLLAPLARGADLDNVVARQGIQRLEIVPEVGTIPPVMESDASLLQRYLLSFERPSAGSRNRYLFEARSAWPQSEDLTLGLWDARINGWREHGRRGDTDVVIIGPYGRLATEEEKKLVRDAVTHPSVQPDTAAVTVINAKPIEYVVDLVLEVPSGPDAQLVRAEALARVTNAATSRTRIGGEIPAGFFVGAAYGPSVIRVRDNAPVIIPPDPYSVPVMADCRIEVEVRE